MGVTVIGTDEVIQIVKDVEYADIDVKKTIEKAATAGYLAEEHFYSSVIQDKSFTFPVDRVLGENPPKIKLDNFYFDILSKALDDEGIYISLAYSNPEMRVNPDYVDEIIVYDDYDLEEDELYFERFHVLVTSESTKIFRIYEEEGIMGHKPTDDIGLIVRYADGRYNSYFAVRSTDLCMSTLKVFPLSLDYPKEHELSLLNPINKELVKMINDVIILKD